MSSLKNTLAFARLAESRPGCEGKGADPEMKPHSDLYSPRKGAIHRKLWEPYIPMASILKNSAVAKTNLFEGN